MTYFFSYFTKIVTGCQLNFVKKKGFFNRFNFQKERLLQQKQRGFFGGREGKWISFQCQIKDIFTACILI